MGIRPGTLSPEERELEKGRGSITIKYSTTINRGKTAVHTSSRKNYMQGI
jgi:hypothetical protein